MMRGFSLVAAGRTAARLLSSSGLHRADKCAQESPVHLRSDGVYVDAPPGQGLAGIFGAINAGRLQSDLLKPCSRKFRTVFILFQGASYASDPGQHALTDF